MAEIKPKSNNRVTNKAHNATSDTPLLKHDIPLNGRLITSNDGLLIGESDFQTLTNFEYTDTSIRSVSGMRKYTGDVPTHLKHRTMHQFAKSNPVERNLLVQSYNSDESSTVIQRVVDNTIYPDIDVYLTPGDAYIRKVCARTGEAYTSGGNVWAEETNYATLGGNFTNHRTFFQFHDITIPRGARISSAKFLIYGYNRYGSNPINVKWYANDVSSSTFPTSYSNAQGKILTTAYVDQTFATGITDVYTEDLSDVVQEIVDRLDWESGNDLMFIATSTAQEDYYMFHNGYMHRQLLEIEYMYNGECYLKTQSPIIASADDGCVYDATGWSGAKTFSNTEQSCPLGFWIYNDGGMWFKIDDVRIEKNTFIDTAYFWFYGFYETPFNVDVSVYVYDSANPTNPTSYNEFFAMPLSTESLTITTDPGITDTDSQYMGLHAIDVSSLVQYIVNKDDWESGNSIMFIFKNNMVMELSAKKFYPYMKDYASSSTHPFLEINYDYYSSVKNFDADTVSDLATTWTANTAYSIGDKVFPSTNNGYYYECSDAGTSHATTEPTWPTTEFESIADGTCRWVCRIGDLLGTFSKAPDGCVAYANGSDVLVWGGDDYRVAKFVNYDPSGVFFYDYTDRIDNSSTREENIAVIKPTAGGEDTYTELLLHFEDNVTDSSSNAHTVTAVDSPSYTASGHFSKAISLNGTSQYLTIPDSDTFDLSGGSWTIDFWIDVDTLPGNGGGSIIYHHANSDAANTCFRIYIDNYISGTTKGRIYVDMFTAGTLRFAFGTGWDDITTSSGWQHVAVCENGDNWYIFINGVQKAFVTSAERPANYTGLVYIGAQNIDVATPPTIATYYDGNIDEFRVSSTCRWTENFDVRTAAYGSDSQTYLYLCSMIPIYGINWYVSTPNTTTCAAPTINYWNGSAWTTVGTVTDNTLVSGKTLAQTGDMTFSDTKNVAKQKAINSNIGFWYQIIFASLANTTGIYYCTTKTQMQKIKDVWDGSDRVVISCQKYSSGAYTDYTTNVLKEDAQTYYDGSDWIYPPETFLDLGSATTSTSLYLGFIERQNGLNFQMPHDQVNTSASTVTLYYWNGAAWTSIPSVDDQTKNPAGSSSFNRSGQIIWDTIDETSEFKTTVGTNIELYYYKIVWSGTLGANTKIDFVSGIAAPQKLSGYNFPVMWLNSLWLCGQKEGDKNKVKSSMANTISVFNGNGSHEVYLGANEELIAGCSLFSRYLNNYEETLILLKKGETWVLDGSDIENIRPFKVSSQYGITSKHTLCVCDIGVEIAPGVNKSVAIWQTSNGIIMFDNGSLIMISNDIENLFLNMYDTTVTERINPNEIDKSYSFYDPLKKCYHWLFAADTSTSLNREYVYDIIRKKWFKVDRGTGNYLQCGCYAIDIYGNSTTYGCLDTGYLEQLDVGNTFDGTDITSTFRLADKPLYDTMFLESDLRYVKIVGICKTTTGTFTLYWYGDTATTGTSLGTVDQSQTGYRTYQRTYGINQRKIFHGIGGVCVAGDNFHSCEPLALSYMFKNIRYQTNRRES